MKTPSCLNITPEEIEALIERLETQTLQKEDYPLLIELIKSLVWMNFNLKEKKLSIERLRSLFGIKTETAKRLFELAKEENPLTEEEPPSKPQKKKTHGHRSAQNYLEAKTIEIFHKTLTKGSHCPDCKKGKLYNLTPGSFLHITGSPLLEIEIYQTERLRCALCGKIFQATLPPEIAKSRANKTAKTIVTLMKYRGGVPFYRQEKLQEMMGTPLSASELWGMTRDVANDLLPLYALLCTQAAQGKIIHNDDTKARILSHIKERKAKKGTAEEEKRTGTFTTGILSILKNPDTQIALFFTGKNHAGENLNTLLDEREETLPPPIQQCDAGHNIPPDHQTKVACCMAHARRKFYELANDYTPIVLKIIGWFTQIFINDRQSPQDEKERLKYHQEKSGPIMEQIKSYGNKLIETKEIEPNSSMGKAIGYFNNHFEKLTLFLREPGVPLTNNDDERLLKRSVLNRKNAYFYRNENGAKIGDILMSTIETCALNKVNPWNYLLAIQEYQKQVQSHPEKWLPWNYQEQIEAMHPP